MVSKIKILRWEKGKKKARWPKWKVKIPKDSFDIINDLVPKEPQVPQIVQNDEISINYVMSHVIWNENEVNIDKTFTYNITMNVMNANGDQ